MLTAILADDESYALQGLKMGLAEFPEIEIVGMYENGKAALESLVVMKPDIAFLDIEMPDMDGVELLQKIALQSPGTKVVFVTAHRRYAEKAFEIGAADYILKPAGKKRLEKTLERISSLKRGEFNESLKAE